MDGIRLAARVILVDETGCVLLLHGWDPARPGSSWWLTPGGGLDPGESPAQAAVREVHEETGLRLGTPGSLGTPVGTRDIRFSFEDESIHQVETYFAARVSRFDPDHAGWTDLERRSMSEHRWWSPDELLRTTEEFYPENLLDLLELFASREDLS